MEFLNRMRNRKQAATPVEDNPKALKHGKVPLSALDSALGMEAPPPISSKKGMKKIATSSNRKKLDSPLDTGPSNKKPLDQQDSNFSVSSNGSYCNESCEKDSQGRTSPHSVLSNRDSGLDCTKQTVSPQNSNSSVHIEKFEQALQNKLANRSQNRSEKKSMRDDHFETAAQRFRRATAEVSAGGETFRFPPNIHEDHQAVEMINSSPEPPMETPSRRQAFESSNSRPKASKQRLSKRRASAKKNSLIRRNSVATIPSMNSKESFTDDGSYSDDAFADDESCVSGNSLDNTSNGNKHRRNSGPLKKSARPSVRQRLHEQPPNVPMVKPQPPTPEPVEKLDKPENIVKIAVHSNNS